MNKKNKMIMMIVHFTSLPRELNSIYIVSFFLLFYFFKIHFYVFIDCLISFFGLTIIYLTFFFHIPFLAAFKLLSLVVPRHTQIHTQELHTDCHKNPPTYSANIQYLFLFF